MDGHKRDNVREYQDSSFLPLMASFKRRMVCLEANELGLKHVEPKLGPDEKRIIAILQDKSSFHANKYKHDIWCAPK